MSNVVQSNSEETFDFPFEAAFCELIFIALEQFV